MAPGITTAAASRVAGPAGLIATLALLAAGVGACSGGSDAPPQVAAGGAAGAAGSGGQQGGGAAGTGGAKGGVQLGAPSEPATCEAAADARSYVGCDFWPTVTLNAVWSIFDFSVVVTNVGSEPADITVEGGAGAVASATVPPLGLVKLFLPWVPELKGADTDLCGQTSGQAESILAAKGAYHLRSSRPVIVYQFSALEFRGAGGPAGKSWAACPGLSPCPMSGQPNGCFSFTNDAAILLPSTAMTGNYSVTTLPPGNAQSFFAVTATQDGTTVTLKLGAKAKVLAGGGLKAGGPGKIIKQALDAGGVLQVVSDGDDSDLSGTLVQADHPVQVIAGSGCAALPGANPGGPDTTCDHLEETVLPVETLGKRYLVATPTGALGAPVPHAVRIYGSVDGTTLTYPAGMPPGAPTSIGAGESVDLGQVKQDFEVQGDNEFAVGTFLLSAAIADPDDIVSRGDPSQSQAVTVDQFRRSYVFLAPDDYDVSFVDVIMPTGAEVTLDGSPLPAVATPIGASGYGVARVRLGLGQSGAHALQSDQPVGIQVLGYGSYTSYQYPGGLDLKAISPPPPPIK
jgi:hypothetical protein